MSELSTDAINECIEAMATTPQRHPKIMGAARKELRALLYRIEKLEKEVQIHRRHNTDTAITALIDGGLDY